MKTLTIPEGKASSLGARLFRCEGSRAAPGFMKPEGVVIFHTAANLGFKRTIEKDDQPKSFGQAA